MSRAAHSGQNDSFTFEGETETALPNEEGSEEFDVDPAEGWSYATVPRTISFVSIKLSSELRRTVS
jgi:hypothetical protein